MDIIFAGGKFRAKSKFANIAKISSTRKIGVTVDGRAEELDREPGEEQTTVGRTRRKDGG